MRISTSQIFSTGVDQLGTLQGNLAKTQMQLSTNRRMLTAADDPIASARAIEVTQSQSVNTQFATNRANARSSLSQVEGALQGTTLLLQDVQTMTVAAGNGALSPADRNTMATELEGRLEDLFGLANSNDGAGSYLFGGFKSSTIPFTQSPAGATYRGDQGARQLQVGSARQMAISDSGSSIFENNPTGNGRFVTAAAPGNTGAGIASTGTVTDASALTGHDYAITFATGGTSFTVIDQATGVAPAGLTGPQPYTSGQQIVFDGVALDIKGVPANGDTFSVKPSQKQSVFQTLTDLISVLRAPGIGAAGNAALTAGLGKAHENLGSALDNVLTVRASVGSRMKELDTLDSAGEDINIQYAATLSGLQDLDVVATISQFTQQQFALEAAQKSFKSMSGLSLFNYIG